MGRYEASGPTPIENKDLLLLDGVLGDKPMLEIG
jgi:hypothetical protein